MTTVTRKTQIFQRKPQETQVSVNLAYSGQYLQRMQLISAVHRVGLLHDDRMTTITRPAVLNPAAAAADRSGRAVMMVPMTSVLARCSLRRESYRM